MHLKLMQLTHGALAAPKGISEKRVFVDPKQQFSSLFLIAGCVYTFFHSTSLLNLVTYQYNFFRSSCTNSHDPSKLVSTIKKC